MGARLNGIEKVWGSNPHTSIRLNPPIAFTRMCTRLPSNRNSWQRSSAGALGLAEAPALQKSPMLSVNLLKSIRFPFVDQQQSLGGFGWALVFVLLAFASLGAQCGAQVTPQVHPSDQLTELLYGVPDVTILVIPTSGDTARVAIAYRRRVPRARVVEEIGKLRAAGWGVGGRLDISDGSLRSDAPKTTYGQFALVKAPQVVNNAPAVLPYLQAFQGWDHVTVVFQLSELTPYNGVDSFESRAIVVRRAPGENAYRYEALIQDHKGKLPTLNSVDGQITPGLHQPAAKAGAGMAIPLLPLMLILLGTGLLSGVFVYSWISKRADRAFHTHNARTK